MNSVRTTYLYSVAFLVSLAYHLPYPSNRVHCRSLNNEIPKLSKIKDGGWFWKKPPPKTYTTVHSIQFLCESNFHNINLIVLSQLNDNIKQIQNKTSNQFRNSLFHIKNCFLMSIIYNSVFVTTTCIYWKCNCDIFFYARSRYELCEAMLGLVNVTTFETSPRCNLKLFIL